jgi:hypothetical protein
VEGTAVHACSPRPASQAVVVSSRQLREGWRAAHVPLVASALGVRSGPASLVCGPVLAHAECCSLAMCLCCSCSLQGLCMSAGGCQCGPCV